MEKTEVFNFGFFMTISQRGQAKFTFFNRFHYANPKIF